MSAVYTNQGTISVTATITLDPDRSGNFWCIGDADDVELQAALVYLNALGGGTLSLGIGTFQITVSLVVYSFIIIEGQGVITILFLVADSDVDVISATSMDGVILRDFAVHGNRANNTTGIGILIALCDYSKIIRVTAYECSDAGLEFYQCTHSEISGCTSYDHDDEGIYIYYFSSDIICNNNVVYGISDHGINVELSANCTLNGNLVNNCNLAGIHIYRTQTSTCSGNILWNNVLSTGYGQIHIFGNADRSAFHLTISNNSITDLQGTKTAYAAVRLSNYSNDIIIEGNDCYGNLRGIYIASGDLFDVLIIGNIIAESDGHGVHSYANVVRILNNTIKDHGQNGVIIAAGATDNAVLLNRFENNILGPIVDSGTNTVLETIQGEFPLSNVGGGASAVAPVVNTSPGGIDIDANGEFAHAKIQLPIGTHQIVRIKIWGYSNVIEATNNMLLQIVAHGAGSSELWSGNAIDVVNHPSEEEGSIVQYDVIHWIIDVNDDAQIGTLAAQDLVELLAVGEAASAPDIATDALIGAYEIQIV